MKEGEREREREREERERLLQTHFYLSLYFSLTNIPFFSFVYSVSINLNYVMGTNILTSLYKNIFVCNCIFIPLFLFCQRVQISGIFLV